MLTRDTFFSGSAPISAENMDMVFRGCENRWVNRFNGKATWRKRFPSGDLESRLAICNHLLKIRRELQNKLEVRIECGYPYYDLSDQSTTVLTAMLQTFPKGEAEVVFTIDEDFLRQYVLPKAQALAL